MAKNEKTVVTFTVRMEIPEGTNAHDAQKYLRAAIASHGGGMDPESPFANIAETDFTVALAQKVVTTTY